MLTLSPCTPIPPPNACSLSAYYTSAAFTFNGLAGRQVLFIGAPLLRFDGEKTQPAATAAGRCIQTAEEEKGAEEV